MSSGHLVQTADLRMHYLQRGTGEPVVLIHGFPETSYSWRHQLAALSEHYAVFAPDTRGFGQTDRPGIRVTRQILVVLFVMFEVFAASVYSVSGNLLLIAIVEALWFAHTAALSWPITFKL